MALLENLYGEPLTLVEAMAAGCFPVCCNVGIVPELIEHERNGMIVESRTPEAFRDAFEWCLQNTDHVRAAGRENAGAVGESRNWHAMAAAFRDVFRNALEHASSSGRR